MKNLKLAIGVSTSLLALAGSGCGLFNTGNGTGINPNVIPGAKPVGWVYSTLYSQNAVLEIDNVQSRATQDPIKVSNGPIALKVDPRGRGEYLYVVCEVGGTVDVVDRRNRQRIRSISVGSQPHDIAITPGGEKAFVTNQGDNTVSVIDLNTQTVSQTIQLNTQTTQTGTQPTTAIASRPRGVAVDYNGTHVYVACASGQVVVLQGTPTSRYTAAGNVLLTGSVEPENIAVSSSSSNEDVYVTDPKGNKLFSFSGTQGNQTATPRQISDTPWGLAVGNNPTTGKADMLFVTARDSNALYALKLPDLTSTAQGGGGVSVEGRNPTGVAVSDLGDTVFVSLAGSNTITSFQRVGDTLARPQQFNLNQLSPQYISPTGDIALGGFLFQ
jgi:YVTN family beta-propeller protein